VYDQITELAGPIIEAYHADLTEHDRKALAANDGMPFLHFSRPCGTHLFFLPPADDAGWPANGEYVRHCFGIAPREKILADIGQCVEYCVKSENTQLVLYYDGHKLRQVTGQDAVDIAYRHRLAVRKAWSRD